MAWYTPLIGAVLQKLNPAQSLIRDQESSDIGSDASISYKQAFDKLESVNRGVNMIVNACSSIDYDVKDKKVDGSASGMRQKTLLTLLNSRPNPFQSVQEFRTNLFTDFLLDGNAFIYYDGTFLYHLPAASVEILPDKKTFIKGFRYGGSQDFGANEVTYFKDISSTSIYRGTSRIRAAERNINILYKMQTFQDNFFKNGAVPGFVLTTENTLSQVAKDKTLMNWITKYRPEEGGKKPMIIDSGLKPSQLFTSTFKDMDFDVSIKTHNVKILETLGVPPVILDGGNQANISPNLRLFYLETIMPIVRKYVSAMEFLSGYDIDAIVSNVSALQPELAEISDYNVSLVNGGIITVNEARLELRYEKDSDPASDELRIPANIAGSAVDSTVGGRPKKPEPK